MQLNNKNYNSWNPFEPTNRDIKRTEQLANKDMLVAIFLTIVFPLFGLLYLDRAVNCLKIIGYGMYIAIVIEQAKTINQARQRKENRDE